MIKIKISKEEIEDCQEQARRLTENEGVFAYYKKRDEAYNKLLMEKSGLENIRFAKTCDHMNDTTVIQEVVSKTGFTPEDYTSLTGRPVPNSWDDMFVNVDESGKVHYFEQNGNVSVSMGASDYSEKYKHIITTVWTKPKDIIVKII